MNELDNKVSKATGWSFITEIAAKLVVPISNMILARLLTPEAFGVVATITVITSFADIFTDAGFQKYLIQHEFKSKKDLYENTTVAFWTNLALAFVIWGIIYVFRVPIAALVGSEGLGNVIAIAGASIPLTAFSSIQMALYKREFDFKTLFWARICGICVPFVVTIPLAFVLRNYWALIIGTIAVQISNAVLLTIKSQWKPKLYYSFSTLKTMLSFSLWTILESISIWLTSYIGTFIVGIWLSSYYVGIYKTSISTVNQILTIITGATTPVLFSALSRVQNDRNQLNNTFYKFQHLVGMMILPAGLGIYLYRDFITSILLGAQWGEAANFIGLWGLTSSINIVFAHYCSEMFRAIGKPNISLLAQVLHLVVLIPVLILAAPHGFDVLYISRSLVRLELVAVQMTLIFIVAGISPIAMLKNVIKPIGATLVMGCCAVIMQMVSNSMIWSFVSIVICVVIYFGVLCISKDERIIVKGFLHGLLKKMQK